MGVIMEQFLLLEKYNRWMNQSIYKTCLVMGQDNVDKNQNSFFPSISKTLNHLLLGDIHQQGYKFGTTDLIFMEKGL